MALSRYGKEVKQMAELLRKLVQESSELDEPMVTAGAYEERLWPPEHNMETE